MKSFLSKKPKDKKTKDKPVKQIKSKKEDKTKKKLTPEELEIMKKEKKRQEQINKTIGKLVFEWRKLMTETKTYNSNYLTFTFTHIEAKEFGFKARLHCPRGRTLEELETLKPKIESGLKCKFQYDVPNHNQFAMIKIIYPTKVKCNEIPFTPAKLKPYELYCGVDASGEPIIKNINIYPQVLIAGMTRRGKNGCLDHIITSWIYSCSHEDIQLYLFQGAKEDTSKYKNCKQVRAFTTDFNEMLSSLEYILNEMERRKNLFSPMTTSFKGDNLYHYNMQHKSTSLPYIYIIIDEFLAIMPDKDDKDNKEIKEKILANLRKVGQYGGSYGINYIVSHQKPESALCPTFLKNMSNLRICFGFTDEVCSRIVLNNDMAVGLPPRQAIITDGESFETLYTTNLTDRILPFIKDKIDIGHRTVFDDLAKLGNTNSNSNSNNKNSNVNKDKNGKPSTGKEDIFQERKLEEKELELKKIAEELVKKEKELLKKQQELEKVEIIKKDEEIKIIPIKQDDFYKVDPNVNKALNKNISNIPNFVPYVPLTNVTIIDQTKYDPSKTSKPIRTGKEKIEE